MSLQKAIELAGSQSALARNIGKTPAHIWNWVNINKGKMPADFVIPACASLKWAVTPHELRPDIYPYPTDGIPSETREALANG